MPLGRPKKEVDEEILADLLTSGWTQKDTAQELGITIPTLRSRIADLQKKEGLILQYRSLQSLELTEIEARVLEAITPQKIHEAPLRDLVTAYKILKDKELVSEGRPNEIKGLVGYLVHLEKEEGVKSSRDETIIDAVATELDSRDPDEVNAALSEEEEDDVSQEKDEFSSFQDVGGSTGDAGTGKFLYPLGDLPDL